jgi:hypothetical protein
MVVMVVEVKGMTVMEAEEDKIVGTEGTMVAEAEEDEIAGMGKTACSGRRKKNIRVHIVIDVLCCVCVMHTVHQHVCTLVEESILRCVWGEQKVQCQVPHV